MPAILLVELRDSASMKSSSLATINPVMGSMEWTMLLTLSVLWGGSFFFVEVAIKEMSTLAVVMLRVGLAACALWVYMLVSGQRIARGLEVWLAFLGMGILNNLLPFALIAWGQQSLASGLAAILNATTPIFGALVAGLLLADERLTPLKWMGLCSGLAGVVVLIGYEVLDGFSDRIAAELAVLAAAVSYAFAGVFGRRFKRLRIEPAMAATGQVTASSLILLPIVLFWEGAASLMMPSLVAGGAILGLALASTALAYILYFQLLARAGATNVLLVTFLIPVSAILLGWLILGEQLEHMHFAGMGLIGLGLLVIDGRIFDKIPMRRSAKG